MYSKLGKGLEAKLWLTVAKDLVGDHPLADTFELNLALVEARCGELNSAKKRLRRLGEMEVPTSLDDDPWTGLPPLFVARSRLAKICELQGQPEEADALLRSVAEDAAVLARENPGDSFMSSYAVRAYYERIQLARRSANTIAEAERAAVKLLESVPGDFRREVEERLELDSSVIGHSR